ncbi:unnamed protein product [Rotaria sordida]|uniref:G-protein coupled receptors family 1 profile domain-containing protein n=1 Tax=Rotaria sordida TaxID=392033 RepID=A0A813VZZ0_9BILA|nr:unnamed protein product [Rotaria sordida]
MHIVFNRNIYTEKPYLIILIHFLIYILPALNLIVQFLTDWSRIQRGIDESCDIIYLSLPVQIFNLFFIYIIPLVINIIILGLGIRHVSSIQGVISGQIILHRRRRQRILLLKAIAFYSIWLILWSPDTLACQFVDVNSDPGVFTVLLSYIQIALDPFLIAIIDIRFLTKWRTLWKKIKRNRRIDAVAP